MGKIYYTVNCPVCCKYGRLEINKDITNNEYILICEECLAKWKSPQDALEHRNGQRNFGTGKVRAATLDEIKALGWDKFIVDVGEE